MGFLPERGDDYPPGIDLAEALENLPPPDADASAEDIPAEAMENLPEPGVDIPEGFDRSEEPSGASRYFRWGTYSLGVLILAVVTYVVIAENWSVAKKLNPGIDELVESFRAGGFKIGAVEELADPSGAVAAQQVEVNGHPLHIYQFAVTTNQQQKQIRDQIASTGVLRVRGEDVLAKVRGPFVLTHWQGVRYHDELLRLYQAFGNYDQPTGAQLPEADRTESTPRPRESKAATDSADATGAP